MPDKLDFQRLEPRAGEADNFSTMALSWQLPLPAIEIQDVRLRGVGTTEWIMGQIFTHLRRVTVAVRFAIRGSGESTGTLAMRHGV